MKKCYYVFIIILFLDVNLNSNPRFAQHNQNLGNAKELKIITQDLLTQNINDLNLFLSLRLSDSQTSEDRKIYEKST